MRSLPPPRADVPITLGFLAAGAWVVFQALDWPFRTSLFPLMTGSLLVGLSLLKLGSSVGRVRASVPVEDQGASADLQADPHADLPAVLVTASRGEWTSAVGWMAGFFLMLWLLGALVTVPLFAVAYLLIVAGQSPAHALPPRDRRPSTRALGMSQRVLEALAVEFDTGRVRIAR